MDKVSENLDQNLIIKNLFITLSGKRNEQKALCINIFEKRLKSWQRTSYIPLQLQIIYL